MRIQKEKEIYHKIRSEHMSDFCLVLSSKSVMCDLIVLGVKKDLFIKIIYPYLNIDIDKLTKRVKTKAIWRHTTRSQYIFYIYDENYNFKKKLEIDL